MLFRSFSRSLPSFISFFQLFPCLLLLFFLPGLPLLLLALLVPKALVVATLEVQKLVMGSFLHNDSVLQHYNLIAVSNSRQTMGNDQGS